MEKRKKNVWKALVVSAALVLAATTASWLGSPAEAQAAAPKLSKKSVSVKEGKTVTLTVKNPAGKVTWKSGNPKVVKVQKQSGSKKSKATLKGMKKGTATVTAQMGKKKLKAKVTVKHVHKWKGYATCTKPDTCRTCGAKRGVALGHSFTAATCLKPATCQRCGAKSGGLGAHAWDANEICSVCNTLNMPRLLQMEITNAAAGTTDRVRVGMVNLGRQEYRLASQSGPFPGVLKTNGKTYRVYLLGEDGWLSTVYGNALSDELCFAIESFDQNDFFTITFDATLTFEIGYYNQHTSAFDKYSVTVTPSGCTFTKKK